MLFAVHLGWLPVGGRIGFAPRCRASPAPAGRHAARRRLDAFLDALRTGAAGDHARPADGGAADARHPHLDAGGAAQDYITFAEAKGLAPRACWCGTR
jgi:ABC-type dipeptide/oligopeptide/nickel transport system permease component